VRLKWKNTTAREVLRSQETAIKIRRALKRIVSVFAVVRRRWSVCAYALFRVPSADKESEKEATSLAHMFATKIFSLICNGYTVYVSVCIRYLYGNVQSFGNL